MTRPTAASAALESDLVAALDLVERARAAVAGGALPQLDRLASLLEGLRGRLGRFAEADHPRLRRRLLALLDEAGALIGALRVERARLAAELHATGAHRQAGAAYRRAGKLAAPGKER